MTYVNFETRLRNLNNVLEDMGRTSGGSGSGWTKWSAAFQCPQKFRYMEVFEEKSKETDTPGPKALEIGTVVHLFLEEWYSGKSIEAIEKIKEELVDRKVTAEFVYEAWRIFIGHHAHYLDNSDPLKLGVKAVELRLEHPENIDYTCRLDWIGRISGHPHWFDGWYIVDHKTASRFSSETVECWRHDGEILGQQWLLMQQEGEFETIGGVKVAWAEVQGNFKGTCINIIGKQQKEQRFARVLVPYEPTMVAEYKKNWAFFGAVVEQCRALDSWPRNHSSCLTRYGRCSFYDSCW